MKSFKYLHRATSIGVVGVAGLALVGGCCTKSYKSASYSSGSYASAPSQGSYAATTTTTTTEAPTPTGRTEGTTNMVVPLYQETINVGKREVESGSVRLKKVVKTETINQPIELRHEEIVIDRDTGTGQSGTQVLGQPFQEGETVISLKREEAVVEKQTTPAGQIVVQTRSAAMQTNVQAQVRREDIDIDKQGNTQNVIIGQNVQRSGSESSGGAETTSGRTTGAAASVQTGAVITDPAMLSSSSDASQWSGKKVQFSGLKVRRIIGDQVVVVDSAGQPLYVFTKEAAPCKSGDIINLNGTIKASADASLSGEAAQELSSRPFYIEADRVEVSNK